MTRRRYVLDSFAVLAFAQAEAGGDDVRKLLLEAQRGRADVYLSLISLGEVAYIVERTRGATVAERILASIGGLPVRVVEVDRTRVLDAAGIKARFPISYADAFVAGLGRELGAPVVTGDREFESVASLVEVRWLPPA